MKLKIKNIMILYNIITILKYFIINKNISIIDFKIDFILLNVLLLLTCLIINVLNNNELIKKLFEE